MRFSRSQPGLIVSAAAHAGLLLATLLAFSDARKFEDAQESVPVDVVTDSQFNQIMKGEKTAKEIKATQRVDKVADTSETKPLPPLAEAKKDIAAPPPPVKRQEAETDDKPEAPPPQKRVAALPPAPEPPARPVRQPAPPAKPQAKAAPEPEDDKPDAEVVEPKPPARPKPEKQAKEAPQPAERHKPKDEPRLKVDEVAKLLEQKKPAEKPRPAESKEDKKSEKPPAKPASGDETAPKSKFNAASIASLLSHEAPQRRASTGKDVTQTASLGAPTANAARMSPTMQARIDAYTVAHYRKCWEASLSINARSYVPLVEFHLTRDGALDGPPRLLNPSTDPVERSRGEQALAAVRRCSPMPIPEAFAPHYDYWRVTSFNMSDDM